MQVGISSIYSFRPHPEHLWYLAYLLARGRHGVGFLTCDASVGSCYPKLLRQRGFLRECPKCIVGGMRSYPAKNIHHISRHYRANLPVEMLDELCASSSYTLGRTETIEDRNSKIVKNIRGSLHASVDIVVENTRRWIMREGIEAVIVFNGRMDMTRAVTYACEKSNIPYITCERPWLGHGLQLIPNGNCLALAERTRLSREFKDHPLTERQARVAGKLAAQRFLQKNTLEWRLYNVGATAALWPVKLSGPKVLILPSSKNEFDGHPDWESDWDDYTVAIDKALSLMSTDPKQCVLRCHPNWAENIGKRTGENSERHYGAWANKRGIYCIRSAEKANTYDLISQADLVIVNGSTAGIEAALIGKKVVCLGHSAYQQAGVVVQIAAESDWDRLGELERHDPNSVMRYALRYLYTQAARFPQYVRYVRAESTTKYHYFDGADPGRLIHTFEEGQIEADDPEVGTEIEFEDEILHDMSQGMWGKLNEWQEPYDNLQPLNIDRRFGFRWVDSVRAMLPRGDR